jgi:type IV secretion system protein VirB9
MRQQILLTTLLSIITTSSIAKNSEPITLFIPRAMANEIENKKYTVPNLKTNRDAFINNANANSISANNANSPITTNSPVSVAPPLPITPTTMVDNNYIPPTIKKINRPKPRLTYQQEQALRISEAYGDGSAVPFAGEAGRTVFIYGQKQPTIICATFTVCMIELEKDERVLQEDIGDIRWTTTPGNNGLPYISIKPTQANLQTNYVVITNKRQYIFKLISTNNRYMSLVSFRYPENSQSAKDKWDSYYRLNNLQAKAQSKKYNNSDVLNGKNLDYNYAYLGDAPFKPVRTWTDNIKTYIQLPKSIASGEVPIFNVLNKSKSIKLVNQRFDYDKQILEIDYKVEHGILQLGQGKDLQIVEIIHNNNNQTNSTFISER